MSQSHISIRPQGGDTRFYSPDRDLAHTFPSFLLKVAKELEKTDGDIWPVIAPFMPAESFPGAAAPPVNGVLTVRATMDELLACVEAMSMFLSTTQADKNETAKDCLARCKLPEVSHTAQLIYFAVLGRCMLAAFFRAVRMATWGGEGVNPLDDILAEIEEVRTALIAMKAP